MLSFVGFSLILVTAVWPAWTLDSLMATWDYTLRRTTVDASISVADTQAPSAIACSYFCSRDGGPGPFSLYYVPATGFCQCNSDVDNTSEDPGLDSLVYGAIVEGVQEEITDGVPETTVFPYHPDCLSMYDAMYRTDGVYVIQPVGGATTDTWCDMTNGGWTVILRRSDGSENFNRAWSDYEAGFGNRTGEYWLGLANMHQLTQTGRQLQINMEAFPGVTPSSGHVVYGSFVVGDSTSKYTLDVNSHSGTCGDSMNTADGQPFSTYDRDSDNFGNNCAMMHRGGWWHYQCHRSMLTGIYYRPGDISDLGEFGSENFSTGIHWAGNCWDRWVSLKSAVMKII